MLIRIGSRAGGADAVDELRACHERIRSFTALARRLGETRDVPPGEVADAAARVRRYFVEALPRHVEDEELSLLPRLRGRSIALDAALAAMHGDHAAQGPREAELIALCDQLIADPGRHAALRDALAAVGRALEVAYAEHLEGEERDVFPAVAELPDDERAAVLAEMRARRSA
jgi:hypothetical protein